MKRCGNANETSMDRSTFKEYNYFKLGINIWKEYNLKSILETNMVRLAHFYKREKIRDAISFSKISFEPSLICFGRPYC
jgi:hypothetical protein